MPRVIFDDDTREKQKQDTEFLPGAPIINPATSSPPSRSPQQSLHWQSLNHQEGDDVLLRDRNTLLQAFQKDLERCSSSSSSSASQDEDSVKLILASWSCILGYCEALATHKDPSKRYDFFPVPITALKRLVQEEFVPLVKKAVDNIDIKTTCTSLTQAQERHRQRVQAVSNAIWQQTLSKTNVRDELHANSVYVCLRGKSIDKKSLDCLGAALSSIAGLQFLPDLIGEADDDIHDFYARSFLTLSEDHAYERHQIVKVNVDHADAPPPPRIREGTCEVAIPGSTKLAKSKRGRDISFTLENDGKKSNAKLTPETSWLYMAKNPVVCDSIEKTLVAMVGNLNPTIDMMPPSGNRPTLASGQLYDLKRDLLWVLYDKGHMSKFPFGIMELGDCEEHRESARGKEMVLLSAVEGLNEYEMGTSSLPPLSSISITRNEELFLQAMHINLTEYNEAQVYPYFYAGHYHKDAGKNLKDPSNEYRLVEAMALYARAAFVASQYPYHAGCIQINKHMTTAAMLVAQDMMNVAVDSDGDGNSKRVPKTWHYPSNAISFGTWLLGFFDALLYWEETSGESTHFVEILSLSHKHSIGKLFALLPSEIRSQVLQKVSESPTESEKAQSSSHPPISSIIKCMEHGYLSHFGPVRSKRLASVGLLWSALAKPKISIPEMAMVIPTGQSENGGGRSSRRAKRPRD